MSSRVVLVTGASRGIGRATAQLFAGSGATVMVHYHQNKAAAEEVLSGLPGQNHRMVQADMGHPGDIKKMVDEIIGSHGRIDILVNNAGIFEERDMTGISMEAFMDYWEQTIRVNLTGPTLLSNMVAREMMRTGGGKIVNVTSRGAFRGEPNAWAYGASKAGLNSVGQSMAKALAPHNIQVYTIAPGFVETDMASKHLTGEKRKEIESQSPMNRVAHPAEIARAIMMLASDGTEYMTGCILDMNGASYLRT
jgi:NAD(P)-dependent dehydrogenase (short-subunit alcohol dehydrogenase family)